MTVRVYRNPLTNDINYDYGRTMLHFFAQALSLDPGWSIIDSYNSSASPARLKGDPMTGGIGGLWGGVSQGSTPSNCWFVVQQVNPAPTFPALQVKLQAAGNANYAEPSGIDYGQEGQNRYNGARVAPWGGWNFADATPDFANPITKVSRDMAWEPQVGGGRSYMIVDDDYFFVPTYAGGDWPNCVFYIGEYAPLRAGQHTPEHPCMAYIGQSEDSQLFSATWGNEQTQWYFNDKYYGGSGDNFLIACPDENGEMKQWEAKSPPLGYFLNGSAYPNEFDTIVPGTDLIEVIIEGVIRNGDPYSPDQRIIGKHKHVFAGWGMGPGAFLQNREYLPLGSNIVCAVAEWDTASNFLP